MDWLYTLCFNFWAAAMTTMIINKIFDVVLVELILLGILLLIIVAFLSSEEKKCVWREGYDYSNNYYIALAIFLTLLVMMWYTYANFYFIEDALKDLIVV